MPLPRRSAWQSTLSALFEAIHDEPIFPTGIMELFAPEWRRFSAFRFPRMNAAVNCPSGVNPPARASATPSIPFVSMIMKFSIPAALTTAVAYQTMPLPPRRTPPYRNVPVHSSCVISALFCDDDIASTRVDDFIESRSGICSSFLRDDEALRHNSPQRRGAAALPAAGRSPWPMASVRGDCQSLEGILAFVE